ncbi:MAG: hypothetical protein ACI9TO_000029 [Rickettsiales bacterium]|jgi:hypothetical protein
MGKRFSNCIVPEITFMAHALNNTMIFLKWLDDYQRHIDFLWQNAKSSPADSINLPIFVGHNFDFSLPENCPKKCIHIIFSQIQQFGAK